MWGWTRSVRFLLSSYHRRGRCPCPPLACALYHCDNVCLFYNLLLTPSSSLLLALRKTTIVNFMYHFMFNTQMRRSTFDSNCIFFPRSNLFVDFSKLLSAVLSPSAPFIIFSATLRSLLCPLFFSPEITALGTTCTILSLSCSLFYPLSCDHPRLLVSLISNNTPGTKLIRAKVSGNRTCVELSFL